MLTNTVLLDSLDAKDEVYGTKMARLLKQVAQDHGIKTSIDVVSEKSNRYKFIVPPAKIYQLLYY